MSNGNGLPSTDLDLDLESDATNPGSELPPPRHSALAQQLTTEAADIYHLEPGTTVGGNYRVIGPLGRGGMGVVLLARDLKLDRDVAIKLIRPDFMTRPNAHALFLREAQAMARTRHRNVVEIYAFGDHIGAPYFVMEYIAGASLDVWMHNQGLPLSIEGAFAVIEPICRGVHALHQAGAVHRDLKPGNILFGEENRIVVVDMGLAQLLGQSESSGAPVAGTPAYMAPEAMESELRLRSGISVDIYSLGVMAYEMLTGRLPFVGRDAVEVLRLHAEEIPRAPSTVRPELTTAYDSALLAALAKSPFDRPRTAEDFYASLRRARRATRPPPPSARIVIADDDEDFGANLADLLRAAFPHVEVEVLHDGPTALGAIEARGASLVITDLHMPGMSGLELTSEIRATPRGSQVPILVVTGVGGAKDWQLLRALGASGFLVKPFEPQLLLALVRHSLPRIHG